jgi:hypothetical protein
MNPDFPFSPPFRFEDLKRLLHLEINGYSLQREGDEYRNLTSKERKSNIDKIKEKLSGKEYLIIPNRYPYWLDDDLVHKVIWVNTVEGSNKNVIPEKIAIEHLLENGYTDFVLFCNSKNTKSISSIPHYHVIYKS